MVEQRTVAFNEDPVCGMTVDPDEGRARGLASTSQDRECLFCGKGCFLEFRDDPETFLATGFGARSWDPSCASDSSIGREGAYEAV